MQTIAKTYNPTLSLIDETFNEQEFHQYHLSLEISSTGLVYAVVDTKRNKYLLFENYAFSKTFTPAALVAEVVLLANEIIRFKAAFKSVSVSFFSSKFTLIPSALFDANLTDKYLEFNTPLLDSEIILSDTIKNYETQCLYAVNKELITAIQTLFPTAKFLHTLSSLLEILSTSFKNVSNKNVIIHIQQTHFELIVVEEKKLVFANTFAYQTSEDFLYFTLFVCEQLKLNPENVDLLLLGEVDKNSAIYSILSKYVRYVTFGKRPEMFEYSYTFESLPGHFYFNLFSQALCV